MSTDFLDIFVDGYNFLMTNGLIKRPIHDNQLEQGRRRLFQLLLHFLPEPESRKKITIVFDSSTTLKLPTELSVNDIKIRFAKGYESADELIVELIRKHPVAKRVLVVSSDHEIQTAASRRKAHFIDSDKWLDQLEKVSMNAGTDAEKEYPSSPKSFLNETGRHDWNEFFSEIDTSALQKEFEQLELGITGLDEGQLERFLDVAKEERSDDSAAGKSELAKEQSVDAHSDESRSPTPGKTAQGHDKGESGTKSREKSSDDRSRLKDLNDLDEFEDIFPPGYGEDLLN